MAGQYNQAEHKFTASQVSARSDAGLRPSDYRKGTSRMLAEVAGGMSKSKAKVLKPVKEARPLRGALGLSSALSTAMRALAGRGLSKAIMADAEGRGGP
ncbi:phage regulatory protein Rha family [Babesia caballi]|uniref:Phage regulatory protein Rha family n=1 Tax=Babesia caballi TaxID=5871 RepID=A0AAV4LP20_BABCB|nr:phage regulatory protein Rha family [Babesia caballi]